MLIELLLLNNEVNIRQKDKSNKSILIIKTNEGILFPKRKVNLLARYNAISANNMYFMKP